MLDVVLQVEGDEELKRAFDLMRRAVDDWRPFWAAISAVFYESERARFASDGFGEWPRLSDGYARWKSKNYPGENIMSRTGDLRRSLTFRYGAGAIYIDEAQQLSLGTNVPYAKYHQQDDGPGRGHLPRREVIGLRDGDINLMAVAALAEFQRYADALGFETKKE